MATKLFLRNTQTSGITDTGDGIVYDLATSAGASSDTAVTNTTASGTEIQATKTAGGSTIAWISGRAPSGGFTLTNTDISLWQSESNMNANIGGRYRVFKRAANGTLTEIGGGPFNDGVEMATSAQEDLWTGNVTDTAFAEDDRILIRYYLTNVGTMASGHTGTLTFNAADGSTGDSFFNIAETVSFKPNDTQVALTGIASTVSPGTVTPNLDHALTGSSATAGAGNLAQVRSIALTGAQITGSAGSVAFEIPNLQNGLFFYYKLADLTDETNNNNDLTNNNSVTFGPGVVGDCAIFNETNWLSHADNASLSPTGPIVTLVAWATRDSTTTLTFPAIVGKWASGQRAWHIRYSTANDRWQFAASSDGGGTNGAVVDANSFGPVPDDTPCMIEGFVDLNNQIVGISVNNGPIDTQPYTFGTIHDSTADLEIGRQGVSTDPWKGKIDCALGYTRRLSKGDKALLYNGGAGFEPTLTNDLTLALTGVSTTTTPGNLAVDRAQSVTGEQSASAIGSVTATPQLALSGNAATSAAGSLGVDRTKALTGITATGEAGTVSGERVVALSGVNASVAIGNLAPGLSVSLSGNQALADVGILAPVFHVLLPGQTAIGEPGSLTVQTSIPLTGNQAQVTVGSLSFEEDSSITLALTGVSASVAIGTLTTALERNLSGVESIWSAGDVRGDRLIELPSVQVTGEAGDVGPGTSAALSGVDSNGAIGSVAASLSAALNSVIASGETGSLTVSVDVGLSGLQAIGAAGLLGILGTGPRTLKTTRKASLTTSQTALQVISGRTSATVKHGR